MGDNLFLGFVEGFSKTLSDGIQAQEKNRLERERDNARALREESLAKWNAQFNRDTAILAQDRADTRSALEESNAQKRAEIERDFRANLSQKEQARADRRAEAERVDRSVESFLNRFDNAEQNKAKNELEKRQLDIAEMTAKKSSAEGRSADINNFNHYMNIKDDPEKVKIWEKVTGGDRRVADAALKYAAQIRAGQIKDRVQPGDPEYIDDDTLASTALSLANEVYNPSKVPAGPGMSPAHQPYGQEPKYTVNDFAEKINQAPAERRAEMLKRFKAARPSEYDALSRLVNEK